MAVPVGQVNGPFSCRSPSSELQPGPPFVQKTRSSRLPSGPGGKNQKKSYIAATLAS